MLSGQPIRFFHASPVSEFHRVFAPTTEEEHRAFVAQTAFTGDGPVPTIVGYGDIHGAYLAVDYGISVFNAGSVGNALDGPGAPYVILEGTLARADLDEPAGHVGITFVRVPYDVEAEVAVAEELGMPGADAYALELREQRLPRLGGLRLLTPAPGRRRPRLGAGIAPCHRVCRPPQRVDRSAPSRARKTASATQTFSNSPRCSDSLAPWARVSGSSTPVTMIDASGKRAEKSEMNGIEPPTPMSTGSVPQASANDARASS